MPSHTTAHTTAHTNTITPANLMNTSVKTAIPAAASFPVEKNTPQQSLFRCSSALGRWSQNTEVAALCAVAFLTCTPCAQAGLWTKALREGGELVVEATGRQTVKKAGRELVEQGTKTALNETSPQLSKLVARHGESAVARAVSTPTARQLVQDLGVDAGEVLVRHGRMGEELLSLAPTKETARLLSKLDKADARRVMSMISQGKLHSGNAKSVLQLVAEYPKTSALLLGYGTWKLLPKDNSGQLDLPSWVPAPVANLLRVGGWGMAALEWCLSNKWIFYTVLVIIGLRFLGLLPFVWRCLAWLLRKGLLALCRYLKEPERA